MINKFHTSRVKKLIETSGGKVFCGGKVNVEERHIEPTIILEPKRDADIMNEEIFGCVLPVFPYSTIKEAIKFINNKDKPLTVYYFGPPTCQNMVLCKNFTSSGHFMVNEVLLQISTHYQGFGGVGASGQGRHGGYEGFKNFSNRKGVMITGKSRPQFMLDLTSPPFVRANLLFWLWPYITFYTQGTLNKVFNFVGVFILLIVAYLAYYSYFGAAAVADATGDL